ncbi:hypothetical protein [Chelatococcus asaccharovorans]|uniref:hypothetical protein n=1 Tax=Chelatococcus asaccharovorans TaxID=28210 RepID=UPI00224C68F4|nr:hypothetical protein [Chelatococcus asaccharovorans]CAH1668837.1 hypothetical protein CHELA17_60866 [Chelatococcus asaccharovorans]CAH1679744.1 hypothetical protein CHELA40_14754 [Chelatococcus asaccharovorans]
MGEAPARGDFHALADQLSSLKGHFILSINDTPEMRDVFGAFDQEGVDLTYTIGSGAAKVVKELIVTTPNLPRRTVLQENFYRREEPKGNCAARNSYGAIM